MAADHGDRNADQAEPSGKSQNVQQGSAGEIRSDERSAGGDSHFEQTSFDTEPLSAHFEQASAAEGERSPSGNVVAGSEEEVSASSLGVKPRGESGVTAGQEKIGEVEEEEEEEEEIDPENPRGRLLMVKHAKYIKNLDKKTDGIEYVATEHLRMSGAYWGLTAMDLMGRLREMHNPGMVPWILNCQQPDGGFGGSIGHDSHLLYTLSAVQILALLDKMDAVDADRIATYIAGLQQPDGSFIGDAWGEVDTRFSYCAISCLSLLDRTHAIDLPAAVRFIASCQNFDGGFGSVPGGESHAGQIFCCVAALAIAGALSLVDRDLLGWWLCERQVPAGGLNGRPEKLPDVCYSWWVLSSLVLIDRVHWISAEKLKHFILQCQDEERGGISDRPNDMVDVFHTFFGIAGLSLLEYPNLKPVDPAYALPVDVVDRVFRDRELKHLDLA
ncbi:hypothetical protein CLOP_g13102 [Closterium sp. NIES-67]|nr:hypothetical protein CLOP_g19174 [Closterium sp. NIES-67]GJP82876.1 hypothetical protein CLOP_g13102 [Closterium sp. NIES-67]